MADRIRRIIELIPRDQEVWDLCCDHGLIGLGALRKGAPLVHFNDQVDAIMDRLERRLARLPLVLGWKVHRGAAQDIQDPVTGVVVIAGIGGHRMVQILQGLAKGPAFQPNQIILSPMTHLRVVDDFLKTKPFSSLTLSGESLIERGRERHLLILEAPHHSGR